VAVERTVTGSPRQHSARQGERGRERLTYWAYRAAETVLSTLPRGVVMPGAAALSNAAYDLSGPKGDIVRANMAQALGIPASDPRVKRAARRAFQNFGRYMAEVMPAAPTARACSCAASMSGPWTSSRRPCRSRARD
jgi:lauroyl/myristoyl acyltransferase